MIERGDLSSAAVTLGIYAAGVGLAVAGALGLADAVDLPAVVSGPMFVAGIGCVLVVHEYRGGPV